MYFVSIFLPVEFGWVLCLILTALLMCSSVPTRSPDFDMTFNMCLVVLGRKAIITYRVIFTVCREIWSILGR